jgi:putative ABC transport system permease protein
MLAVLVCGCVFLALTGPALSLHLRTAAMRHQLTQAGPLDSDVETTADWYEFSRDWAGQTPLSQQDFDTLAQGVPATLAQGVPATLAHTLPVAAGSWAGLTTSLYPAPAGFGGIPVKYATQFETMYRTSLASHVQVVAGSLNSAPASTRDLSVSVTQATAARFRLHPGSVIPLSPTSGTGGDIALYVTGIVRVPDPGSSFWITDPVADAPVLQVLPASRNSPGAPPTWQSGAFADPGQLGVMQATYCPAPGTSNCDSMQLRWEMPVNISAFSADQAKALENDLSTVTSAPPLVAILQDAMGDISVSAPGLPVITQFVSTQGAIMNVLLLLFVSMIAAGLTVIVLAVQLLMARREDELRMLRARGATVGQLARRVLASTALAVGPATAAGVLLALIPVLIAGADLGTGWRIAVLVPLVALCGPPLLAGWRHRKAEPSAVNPAVILTAETGAARFSMAARRRMIAGGTLCAAAVAVLLILHDEGLPAPGSVNWVLTIAPVMLAVPAALVAMRVYPFVIRGLLGIWQRLTATGYVALASSIRMPAALSAYTLVLVLTVAAFCGMVSGGISRGQTAYSWQVTGADADITVPGTEVVTSAQEHQLAAVPGVRHIATVWTSQWSVPNGAPFTLIEVNPAQYAALTADTPFPGLAASALNGNGATALPVVASRQLAAEFGPGITDVGGQQGTEGNLSIRVAGVMATTPAQPSNGLFAIMAVHPLPVTGMPPGSIQIMITGGVDQAKLTALVNRDLPASTVTFRSTVLSSLDGAPLVHAATQLMTLSVVACCLLAVLSLLFGLALGASEREQTMARLAVMGNQRDNRFLLLTVLPGLLAAAAAAVACTLALPALIGPSLNLSVFTGGGATGSGAPVSFRPDLIALCLPGAAIVILTVLGTFLQAHRSRRDVPRLLRVHG